MTEEEKFEKINQAAFKFSKAISLIGEGKALVTWAVLRDNGSIFNGIVSNQGLELRELSHVFLTLINDITRSYGDAFEENMKNS